VLTAAATGQGWGLAVALGIGILLGAERERHKGRGPGRGPAGVRTFALAALLGALAAQLGTGALVAGVAFVGAAALLGYRRGEDRGQDPGLTTEFALVVAVLLGAHAVENAELAAGVGVGVTLLLAERGRLHHLVRDTLSEQELHDGLLFAASALIVLPLVPDEGFGPHDALNPFTVWRLVVIVMAINGLGYVALRILGPKRGLPLAGLIGGFVSSTATVAAMAGRARTVRAVRRPAVAGAVLSTVASLIVTALVVAAVSVPTLQAITPSLIPAGVVAIAFAGLTLARVARGSAEGPLMLGRAFDLRLPLILALIVSVTLVLAEVLNERLGSSGLALATALTGFADAHAAAISAASLVAAGRMEPEAAIIPVVVALSTNSITKAALAAGIGGWPYARRVVIGLVLVLAAAWAGAALTLA
jgi:uncharacterized membrane protein (DUF4010 family)